MTTFVPPAELWEATTWVLEVAHDPDLVMQRALEGMCLLLGADRADSGLAHPTARHYRPRWSVSTSAVPTPTIELPLDDAVLRQVLRTPATFYVGDVREELRGTATGDLMIAVETRTMVVRRLEGGNDGAGVVCVDWVARGADVPSDALSLFEEFITRVVSPVLRAAEASRPRRPDPLDRLTDAERDVCRMAATGASYHEIASARGTSVSTIGHQLGAARRKLGVRNTAALSRLVADSC